MTKNREELPVRARDGWSNRPGLGVHGNLVVRLTGAPASIQITSVFAAAILAAGATSPTYAASMSPMAPRTAPNASMLLSREQEDVFDAGAMLAELRRRAGFTWDDLGKILGVSRRSVHSWAAGAVMKVGNQQSLITLLDRVRALGANRSFVIRAKILEQHGALASPSSNVGSFSGTPILVSDPTPIAPVKVKRASAQIRDTRK